MIERPVVTANDQGADAQAQAGVIAHNDIPAATNDPTDAPKLEMTDEARAATALEPEPTPEPSPVGAAVDVAAEAELASTEAIAADGVGDLAEIVAPDGEQIEVVAAAPQLSGGVWQCQNAKCPLPDRLFEDGTQRDVQAGGVPLHCPGCESINVLYIGESRESAQEVA